MSTVTLRESWHRWGATSDQFLNVVRQTLTILRAASNGGDPPLSCVVTLPPEDESSLTSVDQIEEELKNAKKLKKVEVIAGDPQAGVVVVIALNKDGPAARLEVQGGDRLAVQGMRSELREAMNVGSRWPKSQFTIGAIGAAVGLVLGLAFSLGVSYVPLGWLPDGLLGSIIFGLIYGVLYLALIAGLVVFLRWAMPTLELVPPGTQPRLVRYKGRISAAALFLLTTVIAAFIGSLFG